MAAIYFVTNRRPDRAEQPTDFGGEFSRNGLADLRFGKVERRNGKLRIDLAGESLVKDEERGRLDPERTQLGSVEVMKALRLRMSREHRDLVIFMHGYNVSFGEAVDAATKLQRELNRGHKCMVVLFSWPSDGSMMPFLAYASDRQDAAASGPAFARGFMKLAAFLDAAAPNEECSHAVHLVTHSMGNYVLRNAMQFVRTERPGRLPRLFDQVLMMAADEDDDAFETDDKLRLLPNVCRRVTVYFNRGDLALQVSDKTKGHPDRLGTDGPRTPGQLPSRVSQVDCSDVVGGAVEHSYYVDEPRVIRDMREVIRGRPSDRITFRTFLPETNQYRLRRH